MITLFVSRSSTNKLYRVLEGREGEREKEGHGLKVGRVKTKRNKDEGFMVQYGLSTA